MTFKAIFDFRHPQDNPYEGESGHEYQYEIEGTVTLINSDVLILKCSGDREYSITCIKNNFGAYEGSDRTVSVRLARLNENEYSGDWHEDNIHLLVFIEEV